jgi:hypothetical protein
MGIHKNNIVNCVGILLTAIVQTFQGTLDLYHAIIVMYILSFYDVVFVFGMCLCPFNHHSQELTGKRVGQREYAWLKDWRSQLPMLIYLVMHGFAIVVFFIWSLYVFVIEKKFGPQSSCNHLIKFVFLFVNTRATATWFRITVIAIFSFSASVSLLILGFLILASDERKKDYDEVLKRLFKNHPRLKLVRYGLGTP